MGRILITGGSGFIGTTAQEAWSEDNTIISLDRVPPRERWPGVHYGICDVLEREHLVRTILEVEPDYIVHLAARARVQDGITDPLGTYRANVEGSLNVLEGAMRLPSLKKLVYVSSETVYGALPEGSYPTPEALGPGKPLSVYAASKAAADLIMQQHDRVVVARSAMGCGPRSNPGEQVVSRFVKLVLEGKPMRFPGDPANTIGMGSTSWDPAPGVVHPTRDVSPAWNFVEGVRLICKTEGSNGVYNLGSGKERSILDIAKVVQETLGKGEVHFDPSFTYRPGEEGYRTALDITRARKELGFEPKVSLEEAIRLTADWMKAHPTYWQERRVQHHYAWGKRGALDGMD